MSEHKSNIEKVISQRVGMKVLEVGVLIWPYDPMVYTLPHSKMLLLNINNPPCLEPITWCNQTVTYYWPRQTLHYDRLFLQPH